MEKDNKKVEEVQLKTGPGKAEGSKEKTRKFPIDQANALLYMKNPQWVLDDKAYKMGETELSKVGKANAQS